MLSSEQINPPDGFLPHRSGRIHTSSFKNIEPFIGHGRNSEKLLKLTFVLEDNS